MDDIETLATCTTDSFRIQSTKRVKLDKSKEIRGLTFTEELFQPETKDKKTTVMSWRDIDGSEHFISILNCIVSRLENAYNVYSNS